MTRQEKLIKYISDQMKHNITLYPHWSYPDWFIVEWVDGPTYDQVYDLCSWISARATTFKFKYVCQRKYSEGYTCNSHGDTDLRK